MYFFQRSFRFISKLRGRYRYFPYSSCPYTCIASPIINISHRSGTFVTTDELTLTSHNHSKSNICITVHSWCCILLQSASSVAQLCLTLCDPMDCSMPCFPVHHQLPECTQPMSIVSVMLSNHLILCHPLLLPSIFPSIRVFSNESALCIRWPKYWNFGFNISPSNGHPGLICFRMDWLDLLAVQGTLKSLFFSNTTVPHIHT